MLEPGSVQVRECILRGTDPDSGAAVKQVTSGVAIHNQIYMEVPYTDAASRWFVYTKHRDTYGPVEVWRADLERDWLTPICDNAGYIRGMAVSPDQQYFFCVREQDKETFEIVRTDIGTLEQTRWTYSGPPFPRSLGSMSPDGRTYISGTGLAPTRFGIVKFDLEAGTLEVVHEGAEISNPHPQIEPGQGKVILVQHNRGYGFDEEGQRVRVSDIGATLYVIDVDGGNYQELPVGKPHTHPVQGHQCWIGATGEILLTIVGPREEALEKGNLLAIRPGDAAARVVAKGHAFWHPNASKDGRFFVSDTQDDRRIVVGSLRTGRTRVLCESGASGGTQYAHPHPYLTPDCRWVIFNSDRTGIPQVYAARVPDGLLESLE